MARINKEAEGQLDYLDWSLEADKIKDQERDYIDWALGPDKEKTKKDSVPWYKSYPSALVKGLVEGTVNLGQMMSGTAGSLESADAEQERKDLYSDYIPSEEGFGENVLERGGKLFPLIGASGGGLLGSAGRSALAGTFGAGAESLGVGQLGQSIAEMLGMIGPDFKKLIPNRVLPTEIANEQGALMKEARKLGLEEEDIALSLGDKGPVKDLFKDFATKGGKTIERFKRTQKALGETWETLKGGAEAQTTLSGAQSSRMINKLSTQLAEFPVEVRTIIQNDFNELVSSQMKGEDIINFWQDLNYYIQKGEGKYGSLKPILQEGLAEISPQLAADFSTVNKLYGNFSELAQKMGPDIAEQLIKAGEGGAIITAVTTGRFDLLSKVAGVVGGRLIAREMVTNPRFQNLAARMVKGLQMGSVPAVSKVQKLIAKELQKTNPKLAKEIMNFDPKDFFEDLPEEVKPKPYDKMYPLRHLKP